MSHRRDILFKAEMGGIQDGIRKMCTRLDQLEECSKDILKRVEDVEQKLSRRKGKATLDAQVEPAEGQG